LAIEFTAHNIRLDDGSFTRQEGSYSMDGRPVQTVGELPWFISVKQLLDVIYPGKKNGISLVDLGCLEGGYSVEFARLGYDVLGIEVRQNNFETCRYVQSKTNLPNLRFVNDNAWKIANYG
jgi:hypothetical protein